MKELDRLTFARELLLRKCQATGCGFFCSASLRELVEKLNFRGRGVATLILKYFAQWISILASNGRAESRRSAPIMKRHAPMRSTLAEVPQIDHRISQGLECVVQLTEAIEIEAASAGTCLPSQTHAR